MTRPQWITIAIAGHIDVCEQRMSSDKQILPLR
jgi:hypothetical protein